MDQSRIWNHFQNSSQAEGTFDRALPRYRFLAGRVPAGSSVLNIGVGRAGLESLLISHRAIVSCLDPSAETIARVRECLGLGERAQVGESQAIPFPVGHFDAVIMTEVLEHLSDAVLLLTLREVNRILKPGGRFLGTVPADERLADNVAVCPNCGVVFHRWGHQQTFTTGRMRDLMNANGFLVRRCETRTFPDWRRRGAVNLAKSAVHWTLGQMGSALGSPNIFFDVRR